jgi:phage baseplate assembly protein W
VSDLDFGVDIACGDDLDLFFDTVSGRDCLIQDVRNRLSTPRGSLINVPDYGLDVRAFLSTPITQARAFAIQTAIASEVTKDDRVRAASAAVTFNEATRALRITLAITTADGPFTLTLEATALTVDILSSRVPQ